MLEYPLLALILNEAQCKKIMALVLEGALAKISINRIILRDICYEPTDEGDLNINSLYTNQGLMKLHIFQQNIGAN